MEAYRIGAGVYALECSFEELRAIAFAISAKEEKNDTEKEILRKIYKMLGA